MNLRENIKNIILVNKTTRFLSKSIRNLFFPIDYCYDERSIGIEVISICNAKCIFCNYQLGYRSGTVMSLEKFSAVAKSAVELGYKNLDLTPPGGELFLHSQAIEIIRAAKTAGFKHVGTFTNAIVLHRFDMQSLLESGIDAILISFPGFDAAAYQAVFRIDKFDEFKRSLSMLLETHRRIDSKVYIVMEPRTYLTKMQIEQSDFYLDFVSHYLGEFVSIRQPLRVFDTWGGDIKKEHLIKGMRLDINPIKAIYPFKKVYPCQILLSLGVLSNGSVRLCNCRYDSTVETPGDSLLIGDLSDYGSLKELVEANRSKIDAIYHAFIHGKLPDLCRRCPFYIPIRV